MVDQNRTNGAATQIKGKIKDAAGKVTGNEKLQAEGKADQVIGKSQQIIGEAKDKLRSALK